MKEEMIGERLYRKVVAPVYAADGTYTAGCIHRGADGAVSVSFYRYADGKGIVGNGKPDSNIVEMLRLYGQELKAYIKMSEANTDARHRVLDEKSCLHRCQHIKTGNPPGIGSDRRQPSQSLNKKGLRNQLTNEKREEIYD